MWKSSAFNRFLNDDQCLLVNLVSEGMLQLDEEHEALARAVLADPNGEHPHEARALHAEPVRNGFLIEKDFDELKFLELQYQVARGSSESLGLALLPTLRCNFRCTYCYEEHVEIDMSPHVREAVLRFIAHEMETRRELVIAWFGGEPLLRLDMIKSPYHIYKRYMLAPRS